MRRDRVFAGAKASGGHMYERVYGWLECRVQSKFLISRFHSMRRREAMTHLLELELFRMEKPATPETPIFDLIARRWSPVVFDPRPVPKQVLLEAFEAARWAASSFNEQPWSYLLGSKQDHPEEFQKLASTLLPGNAWAHDAPVLALSVAKRNFSRDGAPNRVAFHDVGMATANLILQALSRGIFVHQMGGYDIEKARAVFEIPHEFEPVAMIAMGYPGDPSTAAERLRARDSAERKRKPIREFVFQGKWGELPLSN